MKGLENLSYEEWLRELGFFSLEEAQGDSHHFLQLKGGCSEVGLVSSAMPAMRGPEEMALKGQRRCRLGIGKQFSLG